MKHGVIDISYGRSGTDCSNEYLISFPKGMTVREFIEEQLKDTSEWGYFGVKRLVYKPDALCCSYKYGAIESKALPEEVLDSVIIEVTGSGGWSRSDFRFIIK